MIQGRSTYYHYLRVTLACINVNSEKEQARGATQQCAMGAWNWRTLEQAPRALAALFHCY